MRELARRERKALSEKTKFRLKLFDWYRNTSQGFSLSGTAGRGARLPAFRHSPVIVLPWKKRYDPKPLSSLENKPSVLKRKRESCLLVCAARGYGKQIPGIRQKRYVAGKADSGGEPVFQGDTKPQE
jgi:hypothetical protein